MIHHQSDGFSKIFQILVIVGSTFLIFTPEYLNNSWWCFSSSFSTLEDRRRVSLKSWSILSKMRSSSLMPSSHNCFDCENSFTLPKQFRSLFSLILWSPSSQNYSFLPFSYCSPNLTGASFKYSLITCDLFILMYLNSDKYLYSFSSSSRQIVPLLRSFSILTVVFSRFLFLCSHI